MHIYKKEQTTVSQKHYTHAFSLVFHLLNTDQNRVYVNVFTKPLPALHVWSKTCSLLIIKGPQFKNLTHTHLFVLL